jgi:1,4-dihydroxy-2-naphthoate octaprenyltransferase
LKNTQHWVRAFRLRTLPLALSSIAMGGFLAWDAAAFRWDIFFLCVLTTIFLQILSNLANDYGDSIHGADSANRIGPTRAVQSGVISASLMRSAVFLFVALSLMSGIALILISFGFNWGALIFFLSLGLLSIIAAISYTVGRRPYGYLGLGDLSVLMFFGVVGVMGSYYLFTKNISWYELLPALSLGVFSVAVLNINNIRDIESDKLAGKFSVPVRLGRSRAVMYHWGLLVSGLLFALIYTILKYNTPWQLLFLLTLPLLIKNAMAVRQKPSHALDPYLKQMAITTLLFVLLFGLGLVL